MDVFELQLKGLFEECAECLDCRLGYEGLQELCERLDLQHYRASLADALLVDGRHQGVTYDEFKEALIKLLGPTVEAQRGADNSPSREVSPKYVFGKKKYGRRSRPDSADCDSNLVDGVEACSVNEPASVKKRKTQDECKLAEEPENSDTVESSEEEMLVAAWAAVASPNGKLSRDQLVRVFQGVGLQNGSEEAASSVFEKLGLGEDGITLEALLSFIKSGTSLCKDSKNHEFSDNIPSLEFAESPSRFIIGSSLLEMWESAGVNGRDVLHQLGCHPNQQYDLAMLSSKLYSLIQASREEKLNLLRAGLVLQRTYICSLKGVMEQMSGENEKLKADVNEANRRAQLLAQEVDDHHSRIEAASARRLKALEQKHAEQVRELTEHVKAEQEQLSQMNVRLEQRITSLEAEEAQARTELNQQKSENQLLQAEHLALGAQLAALHNERAELKDNVQELSTIKDKLHELEEMTKDRDVLTLLERVSGLENENRNLRDKNDELTLQIEHLSSQLHSASIRKNASPTSSVPCAIGDIEDLEMEEDASPLRLTGVKCYGAFNEVMTEDAPLGNTKEICGLKVRTALKEKVASLSGVIGTEAINCVSEAVENIWSHPQFQCECARLQETIESMKDEMSQLKEDDRKLKKRCEELEHSMEQLQEEYERTEEYWTLKLEEERNLFDDEQKQNDQKFSELVNKILEYEEMIKEETAVRQRLETIEEKDGLEKQVLEMEEEYSRLLAEKDQEIERLQLKCVSHPPVADAPVQTDSPPQNGASDSSSHSHCRRSLTFSSGDRRRSCCKVYRLQGEIRTLIETKQAAQREVSALLAERNLLYKQVLSQRREDSCSASLSSKLMCAERRCRTLMSTLRNQQLQTAELLRSTWQQHKREVEELRGVLAVTDSKLQQQTVQIQQQLSKMAAADVLVKDLFVENAQLLAALRKLEASHLGRPEYST